MEWLEGAEVSEKNITFKQAFCFAIGLLKIHHVGVHHVDLCQANMVVILRTSWGIWLDFSCAKVQHDYYHKQELEYDGLLPIVLVCLYSC